MTIEAAATPSEDLPADAADLAGVFDLAHFVEEPKVPAAVPAAPEPAAAVVAPPAAAEPAAPAAPTAPVPAPAVAPAPVADRSASPLPAPVVTPEAPAAAGLDPAAEERLRVRNLEASVAAANAEITRLRAAPAPTPAVGDALPDETLIPQVGLTIPDDVTAAIFGEDPAIAKQGLSHLINSLTKHIYTRVYTDMNARLNDMRSEAVSGSQEVEMAARRTEFQNDYYKAFPDHNKPVLLPILSAASARLAAEYPNAPVDKDWMNALGARVQAEINSLTGVTTALTPPAPPAPPSPAPAPAAMLPADGNRGGSLVPGAEPNGINSGDNIASTFLSG